MVIETDSVGNIRPSKKRSAEKIDGIVSCIMCVGRSMVDTGGFESVYKTRGILSLDDPDDPDDPDDDDDFEDDDWDDDDE